MAVHMPCYYTFKTVHRSNKCFCLTVTFHYLIHLATLPTETGGNDTSVCPSSCLCTRRDAVDCSHSNLHALPPDLHMSTIVLNMNNNKLRTLQEGNGKLLSLREFTAAENEITMILPSSFSWAPNLMKIDLSDNPIENCSFHKLFQLKQLILSKAYKLRQFPDLLGVYSLEHLKMDRGQLKDVPQDLCMETPKLKSLNLQSNQIFSVPKLEECIELRLLDLRYNYIKELGTSPFVGQSKLIDLFLGHNLISIIDKGTFIGLSILQVLDLMNNRIVHIHPEAFAPTKDLKDLNLGNNFFPTMPTRGLQNIRQLKTFNNPNLKEFPPINAFPLVHSLALSYSYHCCAFLQHSTYSSPIPSSLQESVLWMSRDDMDTSLWITNATSIWPGYANFTEKLSNLFWKNQAKEYADVNQYGEEYYQDYKYLYSMEETTGSIPVKCLPVPGPFLPCEDLFGWWTLRCGVWVVFLLAILGNGTVVVVLLFGRSRLDVPRFLVCNLAIADFFMGIYLGILAVVDASTLGEFKVHAVFWQTSAGCQIAGFLGVLSSELSVYTLSVLTLERKYAITNAMHLNKRLSLRHASYIMACGWVFAITMSALPVIGVSDYRKFAICLPFKVENPLSLSYIVFLILANGVAFIILMACYLKMYCSIRGSQAWNTNEYRIAKRMALLVFTDFLCWAPIAFFSLTAVSGLHLISLEEAKVFAIFVLPLNSCANPFLYAIFTKQFKKDCVWICKRIEESRVTRGIGRCQHSSNFSNHLTAPNSNSLIDRPKSKPDSESKDWKAWAKHWFLCKKEAQLPDDDRVLSVAQVQKNAQCNHKHNSSISSENFSSRSDSWKQGAMSLRSIDRHGYQGSRKVLRRHSGDSNTSSIRQDSSTSTFRMSRSSISSDTQNVCRHLTLDMKDPSQRLLAERVKANDSSPSTPSKSVVHIRRKLCRQSAMDDSYPTSSGSPDLKFASLPQSDTDNNVSATQEKDS